MARDHTTTHGIFDAAILAGWSTQVVCLSGDDQAETSLA